MALPEQISVTYTEEDAEYISVRPVVRQTFRIAELADMVLRVTGKDPCRVRHILAAGSLVYNFYRYRWSGFETSEAELQTLLNCFPDPDPGRAFRAADCVAALFVPRGSTASASPIVEVAKEAAGMRGLFRRGTLWDALMESAARFHPAYAGYSYARHGDLFAVEWEAEDAASLAREWQALSPRALKPSLARAARCGRMLLFCPR